MKQIKGVIILIFCTLIANIAHGQELEFESLNFDFGTIDESGGSVSHTFKYKTTGNSPSIIVTAASSCGCTVPEYSRQPVAVGASATVEVTFDPAGRPGKFAKTIQIITAPKNKRYVLTITGTVTPRPKSTEELYPFDMGEGLRLKAYYYPLSQIEQGEVRKSQIAYINTSRKAITVTLRAEQESGKLDIDRTLTIPAGKSGVIDMGYDLQKHSGYYGALSDKYYVDVNGKEAKYRLMINGHAVDDFKSGSRLTPPICNRDRSTIKYGELKRGKLSKRESFTLENSGVKDLIIRQVGLESGLVTDIKSGDIIKPGESRTFQLWIDSSELQYGNFSRYLTLTVNDPDEPIQRVRATATVVD